MNFRVEVTTLNLAIHLEKMNMYIPENEFRLQLLRMRVYDDNEEAPEDMQVEELEEEQSEIIINAFNNYKYKIFGCIVMEKNIDNSIFSSPSSNFNGEIKFSSYDTLGVFVDVLNEDSTGLSVEEDFTSTNFSNDNSQQLRTETDSCIDISSHSSYIEKCLPKWKKLFPWVSWNQVDTVIFCLHCHELLKKFFPKFLKMANVVSVASADKIHLVAKMLRIHDSSSYHSSSIYLFSYKNLISFVNLFNNHYKDMKHEVDVLQTVRSMFNYSKLDKNGFVSTMKIVGKHIEQILLNSLKKSKYYSVVADQCRGIIIVRWLNEKGFPEEHVLWSYLTVFDKTPRQYLKSLDINSSNLSIYIANTLCKQCNRCQNHATTLAALPPRPPSVLSFANLLWNLDFLRPLMSLVVTFHKLWRAYPYKFAQKFSSADLRGLMHFSCKPAAMIKVLENFDDVKQIALEIYENGSHVEALGLAIVNVQMDERHKKILYLLQEIMDTVKEANLVSKINELQIVKLNQAFSSLKTWSAGATFIVANHNDSNCTTSSMNSKSDKIWEFLNFVEKFIDENQKSLYYHGRERVAPFIMLCNTKSLLNPSPQRTLNMEFFNDCFKRVYDICCASLTVPLLGDKNKIYDSVKAFHNYILRENSEVQNFSDILTKFNQDPNLLDLYPEAYELFLYCAMMPFQHCTIARSLFVSFVIEQRVESSIWARMDGDIKPWILYLQHELHSMEQKELLLWWFRSLPSKQLDSL